ncbi:MAG: hypothetical protein MJY93_01590 [Fibrobacter sp.]|nr:hypothetical protein [Fibrobacter sp.]
MEEKVIDEKGAGEGVAFLLDRRMQISEDDWRLVQIYNLVQAVCLHGEPVTFDKVKIDVGFENRKEFGRNKRLSFSDVKGDMLRFKVNIEDWTFSDIKSKVKHAFEKAMSRQHRIRKELNVA